MDWLVHDPLTRLLVQIVVIIAACRGLGLVMRRIGQPSVVAEIGAGVLLGPSVFGWLAPDAFSAVFPVGSLQVVRLLSQLGLLLFMFLIGLELDVGMLKGRGRSSLVISMTSVALPFALACALGPWLAREFAPAPTSTFTFTIFLGAAMSITAFAVLARILSERRLLRTRVGTVAIACAAIDDVIAWCLLACAVSLARAGSVEAGALTTLYTAAYVLVMFLVVRPLLARIAARVGDSAAMSQNLVALVLLLVFVSSWVAERIGIHVLFGAFLFGVILPKHGGFARALAEKLEDLIVVVFLPLYFAMSGLRTEIGFLGSMSHVLVFGVLLVVASAGKFGGAAVAARITGLGWREASAIGVLMNARGVLDLILLNLGLDLGVISPALFSMLVLVALITTFLTAPALQRIYPPSVMARDLLEDEVPATVAAPTSRVMVCVSDGTSGPGLIAMARALVTKDDEVLVLHLAPATDRSSARLGDAGDEPAAALAPALAHAEAVGLTVRPLSFVSTHPAEDIVRVADVRDVDVALLGMHRPVLSQTRLGGVVHAVMQDADSTVAVHLERPGRAPDIRRVLVPFQGSAHDRAALGLAARVQRSTGCEVTVLHVRRSGSGARVADTFVDTGGTVEVETIEHSAPAAAALERAAAYDLVVVGIGDEWGLGERPLGFGLQPERLIRDCPTSLLVVRGPRTVAVNPSASRPLAAARIASE